MTYVNVKYLCISQNKSTQKKPKIHIGVYIVFKSSQIQPRVMKFRQLSHMESYVLKEDKKQLEFNDLSCKVI